MMPGQDAQKPAAQSPRKLMFVLGTRPEAIKLAPVVRLAQADPQRFSPSLVVTGQHREMLDQMLDVFDIRADIDLSIMKHDQNLAHITSSSLSGLFEVIEREKPDCVIVQGDTSTTFAGALAAFYLQVPVAHVEAGLRTDNKAHPFPEEINRRLVGQIADLHFAPTEKARYHLMRDGISEDRIWVTGNTAIDALFLTLENAPKEQGAAGDDGQLVLVTAHRRENRGVPMERICQAILELLGRFASMRILFPVHFSPQVRTTVFGLLDDHPRVELVDPMGYQEFVLAMNRCTLILTDSGGVQEEAPSLGKPVLVLRETTERTEAIDAGTAVLVGTDKALIVEQAARLLEDPAAYAEMAHAENPFGDGKAAQRILDILATQIS